MVSIRIPLGVLLSITCVFLFFAAPVQAQTSKSNILVIFGDDIGYGNVVRITTALWAGLRI